MNPYLSVCCSFFCWGASSPCCRVPIFRSITQGYRKRETRFSSNMKPKRKYYRRRQCIKLKGLTMTALVEVALLHGSYMAHLTVKCPRILRVVNATGHIAEHFRYAVGHRLHLHITALLQTKPETRSLLRIYAYIYIYRHTSMIHSRRTGISPNADALAFPPLLPDGYCNKRMAHAVPLR